MLDLVNLAHGAVALGIGMLVGLERERKKVNSEAPAAAGLRTFAITALMGYVCHVLAGPVLVGVALVGIALLLAIYHRTKPDEDSDITSAIALLLVLVLGGLTVEHPELATAIGIVLTILLALRRELHRFVLQQLSEGELRDGLLLLTVALVVLPLTPDRFIGPYGVLNPRVICTLVVLLMAVGALGHIGMRLLGPRYGLALSAIASGFASGSATIAVLGHQARRQDTFMRAFAAAAVLSNLATLVQFGLVIGVVDVRLLRPFWPSIGLGMLVTLIYGVLLLAPWRPVPVCPTTKPGSGAFSLLTALLITLAITCIALFSAFLLEHLGHKGLSIAAFISGLGDAHAATASIASLVAAGQLNSADLTLPAMMALTGNTITKCVLAWSSGGSLFARHLIPAQFIILGTVWLAFLI
ncbi:uncharacterized membrane protein (DUF4010 family) [Pseudomonas sp. BIGb0278]|uniref:MgtC/SapB family protein n=1 Tax=Pseudomonas sp. BIGb0278 TaxID=2940607 RepID=UPI0021686BB5|nr:MgtC/SapB family protein [Pseudomonas sp. BIGb0278]MCS4282837.1 uncharacterized membrane protein (DUF4010 family) [Pseudomonas sp. BIGb0278]